MAPPRGEVLQGTLDLIVLQTLQAMGPLHGYGIARRVQQVSEHLTRFFHVRDITCMILV